MSTYLAYVENTTIMDKQYTDPSLPGSLGGIEKFSREYKKRGGEEKIKDIKRKIEEVDSYSLYKAPQRKFKTRPVIPYTIDHIWDVDLMVISEHLVESNDGFRYVLGAIDILSRHVWVACLKTKKGADVVRGIQEIFASTDRRPHTIRVDQGREFHNKEVKDFLKKLDIHMFANTTFAKANYIERFWRTLKTRIYRHLSNKDTERFVDVLPALISSYNSTFHRGIKASPNSVTHENELQFYRRHKEKADRLKPVDTKFKYNIGDKVRVSHLSKPFQRSYDEQFTPEVFTVVKKIERQGLPLYELEDCAKDKIEGRWYEQELTLFPKGDEQIWKIEQVFRNKKRKIGGKLHYLVSWKGFPEKCATYVRADTIEHV